MSRITQQCLLSWKGHKHVNVIWHDDEIRQQVPLVVEMPQAVSDDL